MDMSAYCEALWALLPPGPAWSRDAPALSAVVRVAAKRLAELDAAAQRLLDEADPRSALALLPEWESSLGLPDSCSVGMPTLAARRGALVSRLTDVGGARTSRFIQIANALGYAGVTTQRFKVHTCEQSCEAPILGEDWRFAFLVRVPSAIAVSESTCDSAVDDPLRAWGDTELECVLRRECPQPATILISYGA